MQYPRISIIVPVYKSEQYLPKCIDSILVQSYLNWELLLIDDGSPDNSGKICDEYMQKDARIRVFHKGNGGVSSARNFGLEKAKGDYIMFVDSDDWIDNNCLKVCIEEVVRNNLDAVQFGYISVFPTKEMLNVKTVTPSLNGEKFIKSTSLNVSVWGGLYKHSLIEENKLRFPLALNLAEDQIFILTFLKYAKRIKYIDEALYYYLQRDNSAIHTLKSIDMISSSKALTDFSIEWPVAKQHIDSMIVLFILEMIWNNDVSYNQLKAIYQMQNVNHTNCVFKLQRFFVKLTAINFHIACWVIKYYKIVQSAITKILQLLCPIYGVHFMGNL